VKTKFVGRNTELGRIRALLDDGPPVALVSVHGEGGVGKTSLVSRMAQETQQPKRADRVAVMVDFDLPHNRALRAVRHAIAAGFGGAAFADYHEALRTFEELEALQASLITRERAAQRVDRAFNTALQKGLKKRRLLLVFDTFERVQDSMILESLLDLLRSLDNAVVLVAGRHNERIEPELRQVFTHFVSLPVEPLDPDASKAYLNAILSDQLEEQKLARLTLLAEGKPILLDLAATWLDEGFRQQGMLAEGESWPGGALLDTPLQQLRADLDKYRARFQFEVLDGVRALQSPLDWAVLYMAMLEHPSSPDLWEFLLDITPDAAEKLMRDLETLFFVRADHTLHDEMRVLIQEQVWPYFDEEGTLRRETLNRLLDYTVAHKLAEPGWPRWFQEAEELHYRLALDIESGHQHFLEEFNAARNRGWLSECQLLVQTVQSPQHWERLTPEMRLEARVNGAQLYTFIGQEDRMERECQEILRDPDTSDEAKINAWCAIAFGLRDHTPMAAVENYERALALVRAGDDEIRTAQVLNWAAQVYRRLGDMEKSIAYFEESIDLCDRHGQWIQKARAQNNLAYVYRQLGDIDQALNLARMAFVIHEEQGDRLGLAYSYQTIGEIYRDKNDLTSAEGRFRTARNIFSELNAEYAVAYVDVALANLFRKWHEPEMVEHYLDEALDIFDRMRDDEGRGLALNEYGCELRKRGRESGRTRNDPAQAEAEFQRAEEYLLDSAYVSKRMENWYRLTDNLADLTLLYRYWYENCSEKDQAARRKWKTLAQDTALEAMAVARAHGFVLSENRAIEALGDLYYAQGRYFKAFAQYYIQACVDVAEYYGTSLWRYHRVFDRVHRRLLNPAIPDEEIRFIANYMVRRWKEEGKEVENQGFVRVYEGIARTWSTGGRA
jgi:tetratricopeptide (TPR) repeat protein